MASAVRESLIVFSDVHLGSDIHDGAAPRARRSAKVDADLVRLITHYRDHRSPAADRWRIVIAGDFIDFIGMTVSPRPSEVLETSLTAEEEQHGLGSACDHARLKLRRVALRHGDVFAALAAFVADGHALTLIHGNHDIELYWEPVQEDFRGVLLEHARSLGDIDEAAFRARIEFNPWFFYRDGVAYIEHGHQYDPFCATDHVMAPLSPADPRRVARAFCDTLLRFVVRPSGMAEHGHEHVGIAHYLRLGTRFGVSGAATLLVRFVRAVGELFRLRRAYFSQTASILRAEHEDRLAKLAEASRIGMDRLRAVLSLQAPPLGKSIRGILAGVLLDRVALALAAAIACVVLAIYGAFHGHALWGLAGVLVVWSILNRWLSRQRTVDPTDTLVERARHLARLFPAAFVVMGHTHVPLKVPAGDTTTYVNVGAWAEEDGVLYRAPRTHLVIHVRDEATEAQLFTWKDGGPEPHAPKS